MSACQWTIPKLEQAIFLLAQPARWGNKLQSRWLDASALKQSGFEVAHRSASGQKAIVRFAVGHPHTHQHRHVATWKHT